jgi:hypothetical protein
MFVIPQWEHDEAGDYREWLVMMDDVPYPARERRDGTIALNIAEYEAMIVSQDSDYVMYLYSPEATYHFPLVQLIEITGEPYEDWWALPAWEQVLRATMSAWSQCLYTLLYGHIEVVTA